jgi:hypothetical protein
MKLDKATKKRIDGYFDNITPDELLHISKKYGFTEVATTKTISEKNNVEYDLFHCIDERNGCTKGRCEVQCIYCYDGN